MKISPVNALLRSRYALAILAGLLLAASFPKPSVAGLAWIAPGLMAFLGLGQRGGEAFRIGYVVGLAHYLASLYWLLLIPVAWFPILGWLALSAYLALYPAVWVWLVGTVLPSRFAGRGSQSGFPGATGAAGAAPGVVEAVSLWSWTQRSVWALSGAALWVALEMIVARLLTGFPWNLLGTSQYGLVPLIQIASVTGVYGVSFLVVWGSLSLLCAAMVVLARPTMRSAWMADIFLPLLAVVGAFGFGLHKLAQPPTPQRELRVVFVQPSIPQRVIWNPAEDMDRFGDLLRLTEQALQAGGPSGPEALAAKPELLLWPEAAIPRLLRWDEEIHRRVTGLARTNAVWMIVGADDAQPRVNPAKPNDADYFNSSFLISPEGELIARYRKQRLVIFGEYIPLARWLPFLKWFTPITGSFTPGERPVAFELPDLRAKTSVLICFEDVFPHLTREHVKADTDFLVNLTNNGWFGESAAQWQHAVSALFRAVENGLPLLRCANNGLTCWADANGRLRQIFTDATGSVYGAGFMATQISFVAGERRSPTFYNRHGDWFGWACVGVAAFMLFSRAARALASRQRGS